MEIETELKLRIAPEHFDGIKNHPLVRAAENTGNGQCLWGTYFDTPALELFHSKVAFRIRREGDRWIQSMISADAVSSGFHLRSQWEAEVADNSPDFTKLPEQALNDLLPHGDQSISERIVPIFTTDISRSTWELRCKDASRIELCLDQGKVKTNGASAPIHEVELELKSGNPETLYATALALQDAVPLVVENATKAQRGYALYSPSAAAFHKAGEIKMKAGTNAEQAFIFIVRHCLGHLQANEATALEGKDSEGVHQMRVALRRLRACFSLYKSLIPGKAHVELREEIQWIGSILGPARDWDVFAENLAAIRSQEPDYPALQDLSAAVAEIRKHCYESVRGMIRSPRYSRLLLLFGMWLERRAWRDGMDASATERLQQAHFADNLLNKQYKKLCRQGEKLSALTPEQRHQARIISKKLAYGARFFKSLYADNNPQAYINCMSDLRDELGVLNDAAVARHLLDEAKLDADAPARHFFNGWYAALHKGRLESLDKTWEIFLARQPFWI